MASTAKQALNVVLAKYKNALVQLDWALDELNKKSKAIKKATRPVRKSSPSMTFAISDSDADNDPQAKQTTRADFGTVFPKKPNKGDMFLRVDTLPGTQYKWNGNKWIEVSRESTDRYVHEDDYMEYLIKMVVSGQLDINLLPKPEQEEVIRRLNHDQKRYI